MTDPRTIARATALAASALSAGRRIRLELVLTMELRMGSLLGSGTAFDAVRRA
ncbi:MAG TPA: hypothetical protein VHX87_07305 [Galbitalea sp.]|nr:hypothetical protein [Galbitalea sp.]